MTFTIIPFKPSMAGDFKALNIAWLERYFYVEPKDNEILDHSKSVIIDAGGYIYFAMVDEVPAGCFSLIRLEDKVYELGKMAVDPVYQGRKIGHGLLEFAINLGRKKGWERIILYSHTKLQAAIYLYRKFGFREVPLESPAPYHRSDIKMVLEL